jgi:uncharacterized protein YjbJ (UPF0337 family)
MQGWAALMPTNHCIFGKGVKGMNGKMDVVKGRIKEATGVLINNESLRKEGVADQVAGHAEVAVEDTVRKIKNNAQKTIDKVKSRSK